MASTPPAALKAISPFLQRAHELKTAEPIISYWCNYHAAQLAMSLRPEGTEARSYLMTLLDQLEAARKGMEDNDAITDEAAGSAYIENFALKVFTGADAEDRAGKATKATAKRFLAAVNFLELLANFGSLDEETTAKIKYARWKAADLAKAFKEGRTPTPGPAIGLGDAPVAIDATDTSLDDATEVERQLLGLSTSKGPVGPRDMDVDSPLNALSPPAGQSGRAPSPSYPFPITSSEGSVPPFAPSLPPQPSELPPPPSEPVFTDLPPDSSTPGFPTLPAAHGHAPPLPPPQSRAGPSTFSSAPPRSAFPSAVLPSAPALPSPDTPLTQHVAAAPAAHDEAVDPMKVGEAQKHARWAISALNYDDLPTARKELRLALALLGG